MQHKIKIIQIQCKAKSLQYNTKSKQYKYNAKEDKINTNKIQNQYKYNTNAAQNPKLCYVSGVESEDPISDFPWRFSISSNFEDISDIISHYI